MLIKEFDETCEKWQTSSKIDAEEIANLKEKVVTQTIKITELECAKKDEPEVVKQKCNKCSIVTKNGKRERYIFSGPSMNYTYWLIYCMLGLEGGPMIMFDHLPGAPGNHFRHNVFTEDCTSTS